MIPLKLLVLCGAVTVMACFDDVAGQVRQVTSQPRYAVVPMAPPPPLQDSVAARVYGEDNVIVNGPVYRGRYPRNVIWVSFEHDASQAQRQAAIDSIGGVVIGGQYLSPGGIYYVEIAGDSTGHAIRSATLALESLPGVALATIDLSLMFFTPTAANGPRTSISSESAIHIVAHACQPRGGRQGTISATADLPSSVGTPIQELWTVSRNSEDRSDGRPWRCLITDERVWQAFSTFVGLERRDIDFDRVEIIAAVYGIAPQSYPRDEIVSIHVADDTLIVRILRTPVGCLAADLLSWPMHVTAIPRQGLKVRFEEWDRRQIDCTYERLPTSAIGPI